MTLYVPISHASITLPLVHITRDIYLFVYLLFSHSPPEVVMILIKEATQLLFHHCH